MTGLCVADESCWFILQDVSFFVGCGFTCRWRQQSLSSLGSLTQKVWKRLDFDYSQIWKTSQKNCQNKEKLLKSGRKKKKVWNKVLKEVLCVGAQMNDGDAAKLHMREQTALSSLCCPRSVSLKGKSNLKHLITVLKKQFLVPVFLLFPWIRS